MRRVRGIWLTIVLLVSSVAAAFALPTGPLGSELGHALAPFAPPEAASDDIAFARVDALTLASGEDRPASVVIDSLNGFAYIGTFTKPALIVKVNLATFERVDALESGEDYLPVAVIDPENGFAYFGTSVPLLPPEPIVHPARIVKVDLSTFARVGTLELEAGEDRVGAGVIDPANGFAYFGIITSPARVVKIDLATFERVDGITLEAGENLIRSGVIDPAKGFAYFGTWTSPGRIVKVNLTTFERVGTLTLGSGESNLLTADGDLGNGFAYFATWTNPGRVVKVDLTTFERVGAVTLEAGEETRRPSVIDPAHGYAYFGTLGSPARVVKVGLDPLARLDAIILASGERDLFAADIDLDHGFAYFLADTSPGRVVKMYVGPDPIPPAISGVAASPDPAEFGVAVTISGTVTDDLRVASVAVEIFDPDGASDGVFPMAPGAGATYTFTFTPDRLGTYTFRITAVDSAGNVVTANDSLFVEDNPPVLAVQSNAVAEATGPDGAVVTYTASAEDVVDGPLTPTCSPPSGSTFPLGTTTVTCQATDSAGNTATASFSVTVHDTTPPMLTLPSPVAADATGPDGAVVAYTATAADIVDGPMTPTCSPPSGSTFPVGTTTVTCTAIDARGNTANASFLVTVSAPTPPLFLIGLAVGGILIATIAAVYFVRRRKRGDTTPPTGPPPIQ